jgi:hypothetical protein
LACRVLGHRTAFAADGRVLRWACERDCGTTGHKTYPSAADATRYATAFNRRDSDAIGKRAPLIGLLPLRLWRLVRRN